MWMQRFFVSGGELSTRRISWEIQLDEGATWKTPISNSSELEGWRPDQALASPHGLHTKWIQYWHHIPVQVLDFYISLSPPSSNIILTLTCSLFRIKIQTRVNAFNSNVSQIDLWTVRRCFRHLKMYSNSGKLWSKGSSNFNIAKNSFIYAFTAIKVTTAILNTYVENVSSISRCVWLWKDPAQFCLFRYISNSFFPCPIALMQKGSLL